MIRTLVTSLILSSALFSTTLVAQDKPPVEEEMEKYWSTDRELPVIRNKLYQKEGKIQLGLMIGLLSSEPFFWYTPVGLRFGYHFSDHVAVELGGTFMGLPSTDGDIGLNIFTHKTEITGFFEDSLLDDFDATTDLQDRFLWRANATLVWSPLYGKWAFLNNKLTHFDFNLVLGAGVLQVDRPSADHTSVSAVITPEVVFGGGAAFFLSKRTTLRLDGRFYAYQGAETQSQTDFFERLKVPAEFLLGVSFLF